MSKTSPIVSIVIPVYNGADTIGEVVRRLDALDIDDGMEIVLVNDASRDNSADVCRSLVFHTKATVIYVEHRRNFGEHNAVMTGLRHTRGDYVITMDDDLQNDPDDIPALLAEIRAKGYDVVYTYFERKQHAAWRNWGSRFSNWTADMLLEKPKGLYLSTFRCIDGEVAREITAYGGSRPYVDGLLLQVTQNVGAIPVRHLPRTANRSNYTLGKLVSLWWAIAFNFSTLPMRFFALLGLGMTLGSLLGILYVLFDYFVNGGETAGWASLMIVVLFVAGVQFVFLSLIGEYAAQIYLRSVGKPQSSIRDTFSREILARRMMPDD